MLLPQPGYLPTLAPPKGPGRGRTDTRKSLHLWLLPSLFPLIQGQWLPAHSSGSPYHFGPDYPLSPAVPASIQWRYEQTVLTLGPEIKSQCAWLGEPSEVCILKTQALQLLFAYTVIVLFTYKLILLSKYLIIICSLWKVNILLFSSTIHCLNPCVLRTNGTVNFSLPCLITNLELMKSELVKF